MTSNSRTSTLSCARRSISFVCCVPSMGRAGAVTSNARVTRRSTLSTGIAAAAAAALPSATVTAGDRKFYVSPGGVKYFDLVEGNGYAPQPGDIVIIDYKSLLSNGELYDSSTGPGRKPLVAKYKSKPPQMIPGWEEVLGDMREGGTRVLQVPPAMAYGDKGVACDEAGVCLVPPNEVLQFQLTLKRVALPPP
eukprot:CAMPEP_0119312624 /NCGR_PEP_ID=MMETSP1333-20130426/26920_1 /TAXON_ID=418940 /ORGANISM="Scyphosphaera apsteinii, Strain RCC1455" /LENGTH=192 /DNA_ID=CAMNT_0007317275 /DNA_START=72 /DNA_END=650 /DNA_ORIENTATION=+